MPLRNLLDPDFQERYDVLLDIGRVLTATLAPEALYRTIYEQASRVLETTGFFISLYDDETDRATVVFYADRGEIERPGVTYRGSESRAIREARPILESVTRPEGAVMLLGPETDPEIARSVIAAPLMIDDRVLGVISAQSYQRDAFTELDLELLSGIAGLAAVAVSNARAVSEIQQRRRESERMEEISRALTASLDLREVLERIVQAVRDLVEADGAAVWLLRDGGRAEIAMTAGALALPVGTSVEIPDALHSRMLRGEPIIVRESRSDAEIPPRLLEMLDADSAVGVPLIADQEVIGALSVSHMRGRHYAESEIRLLERFAFNAAVAVSNARLHEQIRTLSLTDPLTLLPNRRHMDIFLQKEFAAAERVGRDLAVILFDLDDFKAYNDTRGHQAGDALLRRFARILEAQTRAMNLAARYGGDEFILVLSDTDHEGARMQLGRVVDEVRADAEMNRVGVTAGMAVYHSGMTSPAELIQAADRNLYRNKTARRGDPPNW